MLLVEFTINATVNYLSTEYIKTLTHQWRGRISNFDPPQRKLDYDYGGYCKMGYGSISFFPDLFDDDWPPPINGAITIKYTATTEAAAETLFTGIAHLEGIKRDAVTYGLYGENFDEEIVKDTAYNGTLDATLTTILTAIAEITAINTDNARVPSPNVVYTVSGDKLNIDLASAIAAYNTHLFYKVGTTVYLIDMKGNSGTAALDGFDFSSAVYPYNPPIALARAGDYTRLSSYTYGKELSVEQMFTPSEVTGATQANPCVITAVAHPFSNGEVVRFYNVKGMTELNGNDYTVANKAADTFELSGIDSTGYGAYESGGEVANVTNINTALDDIITIMNRPRAEISMPFLGSIPTPGAERTWTDESQGSDLDVVLNVRNITYEFNPDRDEIILKGDGALS